MRVVLLKTAKRNIKEIYEYIARDSIYYAMETTRKIRENILELKRSPYLGRYILEIEDKRYRELLYKSYRIVYMLSLNKNTIYILFVAHGKRNFKSIFRSSMKEIEELLS